MMKKFIALLITISLLLLNSIPVLGKSDTSTNYPGQSKAADIFVGAIKANDIDKIEAMFSVESQNSIKDLHKKIEHMVSAIDGNIISYDSEGFFQGDSVDLGYRYSEVGFDIIITTENKNYCLTINWITNCSSNSEKIGIEYITFSLIDNEGWVVEVLKRISPPYKRSVAYKRELKLLKDGAIDEYKSEGYDSIIFTSSDESIITVSSEGVVTTKGIGTAIVTKVLTNTKTGKVVETEYEITVKLSFWQKIIWYCLFGFLWY